MGKKDDAELEEAKRSCATALDEALARLREGVEPSNEGMEELGKLHGRLYALLQRRNLGERDTYKFDPDDRVTFYVESLKLAALDHFNHEAWPARALLRRHVLDGLLACLKKKEDPWLRLCAVTAALAVGSSRIAGESYARIEGDQFLSDLAIRWANLGRIAYWYCNEAGPYDEFLAKASPEDAWNAAQTDVGGRRWILLASIYPDPGVDPRTTLRDPRSAACSRLALKKDWNITDRESALGMLEWLKTEGHSALVMADLAVSAPGGEDERTPGRAAQRAYVAAHRDALARHRILAWDVCRLIAATRSSYAAGYIDESEALGLLDWSGRRLSETYGSWEEMGDDYVLGCGYWEPSEVGKCSRCATVHWLEHDARSPWRRVPFHGRDGVESTVTGAPEGAPPPHPEMKMSRKSVFLEIPAEAYGMLLAGAVLSLLPPLGEIGDALVGGGIPAAVVGARNMWLPGVFPTPRPRPRTTFLRKVWAYALTIFGGFLALVFGLFFHAGATDTSHREIAWPFLIVALLGLWIAFAGMRRLRWE